MGMSPVLCAKSLQSCPTLGNLIDCSSPGSSVYGDSPGKNTGVGHHFFLQGIFPTQGLNPGLPDCRQIDSLPSQPLGKPKNTSFKNLTVMLDSQAKITFVTVMSEYT